MFITLFYFAGTSATHFLPITLSYANSDDVTTHHVALHCWRIAGSAGRFTLDCPQLLKGQ